MNRADGFQPIAPGMLRRWSSLHLTHRFGDTTFTLLYVWNRHFAYACRDFGRILAVKGTGISGEEGCILLKDPSNTRVDEALSALARYFHAKGRPLTLEYVAREELEHYTAAARRLGLRPHISYDPIFSDYVYDVSEFTGLTGNQNKRKRGDLNYLTRAVPALHYERGGPDPSKTCMEIFDAWCARRDCRNCFYGCEKKAFALLWDIYDPSIHHIGLTYDGEKALSFAVTEQINRDTVCCFFQKNAVPIRGLTYYLNREMALSPPLVPFLNVGEDMGVPGIAADKSHYRPCRKEHKYTIRFSQEERP